MLRRYFISTLIASLPPKKKAKLDKLIFEYEQIFNSATFLGDQVIYDRKAWDAIREAFTKLMEECVG